MDTSEPSSTDRSQLHHNHNPTSTANKQPQPQPRKSVEGWIIFATGIPPEAETEDVRAIFAEYAQIHSIHLNVDRRTGYLKGYALIEYEDFESAQMVIDKLNNTKILDQTINVGWCFLDPKSIGKSH